MMKFLNFPNSAEKHCICGNFTVLNLVQFPISLLKFEAEFVRYLFIFKDWLCRIKFNFPKEAGLENRRLLPPPSNNSARDDALH